MRFISETTSNGVSERLFTLDDIPGVLWSPADAAGSHPLVLLGHGGGQHKKAQGLVARAHRYVTVCGFAVAAIDAPATATGQEPSRTSGPWQTSGSEWRRVSPWARRSPATTQRWRRGRFPGGRPPWTRSRNSTAAARAARGGSWA